MEYKIRKKLKTFEELGVSEQIRRAIEELGFVQPMPVQEEVIPYLLGTRNDVIALAQTGTGKTAAFGIPLLQRIDVRTRQTQAIVLSPTRELCLQIADDLNDFGKYIEGIHVVPVYGGTDIVPQMRALKKGAHIIVATPGRLIDLVERGVAQLNAVSNVVLDEADEMLNMGFSEDLNTILAEVPTDRNTLLFSATMSKEIEKIARNFLHDPKEIVVGSRNEGAEHVNHIYYMVNAKDKYAALKRIVDFNPRIFAIIFCRTKVETQEVADLLIRDGYNAESLHGDLSQQQRDLTMAKFRQHTVQLLVATDVAARGLDVDDLTHVINYGLPNDIESYTHRSGRTGRAGKKGTSISIVHTKEKGKIRAIEKEIQKEFVRGEIPTPEEICKKQLYKVMDQIVKTDVDGRLSRSCRTSAAISNISTRTTSSRRLCRWSLAVFWPTMPMRRRLRGWTTARKSVAKRVAPTHRDRKGRANPKRATSDCLSTWVRKTISTPARRCSSSTATWADVCP